MLTSSMRRNLIAVLLAVAVAAAGPAGATPAAAQTTTSYTFKGRGWGHGIGMSQWGARGLAEKGRTSTEILKHYYSGVAVQSKPAPSSIRVGLLQERDEIWIEGDGRFDLHDRTGKRRASGGSGERWRIVPRGSSLDVFKPGQSKAVFSSGVPVTVRWEQYGTLLKLPQTGYTYKRGRIDADINSATGKSRAIGILGFEEYLYGLGEMPSSWHNEALEAQAIAGRTYALEKIARLGQNRSVCNCAVYATTADQAYVGSRQEVTRWVNAVKATSGEVVTYAGEPIQALYSSSSGGYTEHNENVWGGTPLRYLRGRCDPGDYFKGENPHNRWTVTYTSAEIESRMRDAGHNIGTLQDIDYVPPRGVSGRLTPVKDSSTGGVLVEGTLKDVRMSGGSFRSILGLKTSLVSHHIFGAIRLRYDALDCKPGLPSSGEFTWRDLSGTRRGAAQNFASGRLFWNSTTKKVFWVKPTILAHYDARRKLGHDLGMPLTDQVSIAGGAKTHFERGHIYWSSATGAREVHGAILGEYLREGGPAKWGFPTTDERKANEGRTSRFQKARIYWTSKEGAHIVYGGILARYLELGGGHSDLRLPTSDEYSITNGRRQDFQGGYITWNRETGKTSYKLT